LVVGFGHDSARAPGSVGNVGECGEGPQKAEIKTVTATVDNSSQKSQQRGENEKISSLSSEKDVSLLSLSTEFGPRETSLGSVDEENLDDAQSAAKPKECSVPDSCESGLRNINVIDGKSTKLVPPPPGFDPLMPAREIPVGLAADPLVEIVPAVLPMALNSVSKMPYCCEPEQSLELCWE